MDRLPDKLESNARIEWRAGGVTVGTRRIVDFISDGVTVSGVDDGGLDDKVTLTLTGTPSDPLWEFVDGDFHPTTSDVSFTVDIGSGESTFTMNDSGQVSLFGNEWVIVQGANETIIGTSSPFYSTGDMPNSTYLITIDEGTDTATLVAKYSDSTVKTLTLGVLT